MASIPRASLFTRAVRARPVAGRRIFNSRIVRRNYASGGDHPPPGSDLPWMAGASIMTAGGLYLIWPDGSAGHGDSHGHGHDSGHEEAKEEDAPAEEEPAQEKEDSGEEEKSDDSKQEESSGEDGEDGEDKRTAFEKYDGKPKGGRENTSSKEGPEHTGARHASSPHSDESKSRKGEGIVETARVKGTIDPKRSQV